MHPSSAIFVALAPALGACSPAPPALAPSPAPVTPAWTATPAALRGRFTAFEEAWNRHDVAQLTRCYEETARVGVVGREGLQERPVAARMTAVAAEMAGLADVALRFTRIVAQPDRAAAEWRVTATHAGKRLGYRGASFFELGSDGRIVREHVYFDEDTVAAQRGATPAPGALFRLAEDPPSAAPELISSSDSGEGNALLLKEYYAARATSVGGGFALMNDDVLVSNAYEATDLKGRSVFDEESIEARDLSAQKFEVGACVAAWEYAACEYVWTPTWAGDIPGASPRKNGSVHVLDVVRVKGGKLSSLASYANAREMEAAFGLEPAVAND